MIDYPTIGGYDSPFKGRRNTMDAALSQLANCPVLFQGFESSLGKLFMNGWNLHTEYNNYARGKVIYFGNETLKLAGFATDIDMMRDVRVPISINRIESAESRIMLHESVKMTRLVPDLSKGFQHELELGTTSIRMNEVKLCDVLQFEKPVRELIVDPNEVNSLMERVIELQRPKQAELREKARKEQYRNVEAKIVTLFASEER